MRAHVPGQTPAASDVLAFFLGREGRAAAKSRLGQVTPDRPPMVLPKYQRFSGDHMPLGMKAAGLAPAEVVQFCPILLPYRWGERPLEVVSLSLSLGGFGQVLFCVG